MNFTFVAATRRGTSKKGLIEALTQQDAIIQLERRGLKVIRVEQDRQIRLFEKGPNLTHLALFFRQLALMQNAGVNLVDSLASARNTVSNKRLREVILDLEHKVGADGSSLHDALAEYPKVFDPVSISFVTAAEQGGKMSELKRLADMMTWRITINSKIRKAAQQPLFTLVFALIVMYFLTTNIVPQFSGILKGVGGDLPALTRFMMGLAVLLKTPLFIVTALAVLVGAPILLARYVQTPAGRLQKDTLLLKLPKVKDFVQVFGLAQASATLRSLLQNGLPQEDSLRLAGMTSGNVLLEQVFEEAARNVRQGGSIAEVFEEYPLLIPEDYTRIVRSGERSSQLVELLEQAQVIYNTRVDETVEALTGAINPLLTIFIGFMVGLILMSVFLPLSSIISNLSK